MKTFSKHPYMVLSELGIQHDGDRRPSTPKGLLSKIGSLCVHKPLAFFKKWLTGRTRGFASPKAGNTPAARTETGSKEPRGFSRFEQMERGGRITAKMKTFPDKSTYSVDSTLKFHIICPSDDLFREGVEQVTTDCEIELVNEPAPNRRRAFRK